MILVSVVPVSVFAVNSGTTNVSGKYNSFQDSNEKVSSMQEGQEVKFIGTAIEYHEGSVMPGDLPRWKVSVDEIISGPSELKGHTVFVAIGTATIEPGYMDPNIKSGDIVKVYGIYREVDNVWLEGSNYYLKKVSSECLSITVWTDKPEYKIGETVTIYYQTNTACTAKLTVTKPDGTQVVVGGPNDIPVCTRSKSAAAGYPTGTRTVTFEAWTSDESKKATCYFDVVEDEEETKPVPKITKVDIDPSTCVNEDEYATISVTVANNGGASSEGYISVSFPNDEYVYVVSGTGNEDNKVYQKDDDLIWNSAGVQMKAVDPLVELYDSDWDGGQQEFITMNVKPNSGSDEIVFYVRAALKNDADGDYERDPTYSGNTDQQGWYAKKYSVDVCDYEKVKIRGEIIADQPFISYYNYDVKIDEVLEDPTGNLQEGETVNVYGHLDGPAQVDDVTVGDEVEVYGEYRGYGGEYKQIFLSEWGDSSSDHYVKKIEPSFELISPDLTSELELYKTHNIHIRVKSSTTKGGTIVASLMFTSKFEKSQREVIINLKDDDFDGIYEYDYSLEPFEQMAMDSVKNSVKTKDAEALYNSICDYFSSTIGTYNLTLKYYDESSEKAEYLDTQSLSICSPYLRGYNWKWEIEKVINDDTFQPPSERMWGGHWTTLEDVQESMTETVLYLSEDNEGTAYLDLSLKGDPTGVI
ncbi:hypothetical protein C5S39_00215, partial [Candidatus Methanophagaceae archaeon]